MTTNPRRGPTGLWEDLPPELLSSIAEDLGITDLLGFRGVCKSWRASASLATARVESLPSKIPWFLIHSDIKSKCLMYSSNQESYEIEIPELEGVKCLASSQGWLLLANNQDDSMFFLCPLSRSRIDLPRFPLPFSDRVAAFSSPPTSEDCAVCVPYRNKKNEMQTVLLFRGRDQWAMPGWISKNVGSIESVTFTQDKKFCFLSSDPTPAAPPTDLTLSYAFCQNRTDHWEKPVKEWLGTENDIALSICGTVLLGAKRVPETDEYTDVPIRARTVRAETGEYRDICIVNKTATVDPDSSSRVEGIWFHPRFFELPLQCQSWSSL